MSSEINRDPKWSFKKITGNPIILPPGANPWNYRVNVNHPLVRPIYEEWTRERHIIIPSDAERHHFEIYIQLLIDHGELPAK